MTTEFDEIKAEFNRNVANPQYVFPGLFGAAIGILTKTCGSKENRQLLQKQLTGHVHSGDFNDGQVWALVRFVSPVKAADGHWMAEFPADFEHRVRVVLAEIGNQLGQEKMF